MLFHIARREFVSNILTARFAVGFILCLFLFLSSAYVLTGDYEGRLMKYSESVIEHQKGLEKVKVYSQLRVTVDRRPEKLSIFCEGFDKQLGATVTVAYDEVPAVATGYSVEARENTLVSWMLPSLLNISPLLTIFPPIDIALIVQVVLSILALLFAYDTIAGEKERGTLALTLSNAVPRSTLLFGKYIGGMLSIVLPFSTSFLVSLMVVRLSPAVQMYASDWVRLLLIFLCSLIYISLFFTLGMFISSRTSKSATALIILLFLWVALVMLLPNAGAYIAKRIRPVETMGSIDLRKDALNKEMEQKMKNYASKHPMPEKCYITTYTGMVHRGDWPFVYDYIHNGSRNIMQWYLEGTVKFWVPLRMEYARKRWELYRQYYDNLEKQATLARDISRLSPAWTFYNVTSIFAGTDIGSHQLFMEKARRYRSELIDYLRSKKALSSMAWFTRVKENELLTDGDVKAGVEVTRVSMDGRMITLRKIGGKGDPRWDWKAVKPLNLSDMPKFPLDREELSSSLKRALLDLVILIILNVALFMGTYVSFIKADVK